MKYALSDFSRRSLTNIHECRKIIEEINTTSEFTRYRFHLSVREFDNGFKFTLVSGMVEIVGVCDSGEGQVANVTITTYIRYIYLLPAIIIGGPLSLLSMIMGNSAGLLGLLLIIAMVVGMVKHSKFVSSIFLTLLEDKLSTVPSSQALI